MCSSLSAVRPALLRFAVVGQYEPGERLVGIALHPLVIRIDAGEAGRYLVAGEVFSMHGVQPRSWLRGWLGQPMLVQVHIFTACSVPELPFLL